MLSLSKHGQHGRGLAVYALAYLVFLYVPVLLLPLFSFNDSLFIAFPLSGFTIQWYAALSEDADMRAALLNTLSVGTVASLLSTILGLLAAKALIRPLPGRALLLGFANLSLFIPEIVIGIALLILITTVGIPLSLMSVVIGHVLICIPFAILVLMSRFEGFDASLEEASRDLGESAWMTFWRVTFPLMLPGIVASLLLTFIVSFDDFMIAFFLCGTDTTLPVYIFGELRFPYKLPTVLALGSAILIVSAVLVAFAEWVRRFGLVGAARDRGIGV
ncbi:MAG TPA: ABC transporter permease [Micropepsaceae bacterium]|nr:ABC transporter permease [Micropepsaceae bacterium]